MQPNVRYRRKQYLVAKKIQLKYTGLMLGLVFLTAVMCSYVTYYTMMVTMGEKIANVYPQGRLMAIVNTVNFRILFSMVLIAPLIVMIGIFASHKIAGPISRIERFLGAMADGDYSSPITLRRKDELLSLADGINKVVASVSATVQREKVELVCLSASLENIRKITASEPVNYAELNKEIGKLSEEVSVLSKELEKYKI